MGKNDGGIESALTVFPASSQARVVRCFFAAQVSHEGHSNKDHLRQFTDRKRGQQTHLYGFPVAGSRRRTFRRRAGSACRRKGTQVRASRAGTPEERRVRLKVGRNAVTLIFTLSGDRKLETGETGLTP